jgi:uncharacterized protein YkwD
MKRTLRVFILFAALLSLFTSIIYAASKYPDVSNNHWAFDEIEYLSNEGVISGYEDGSFQPSRLISRAEAAIMLVRALKYDKENRPDPNFSDVSKYSVAYDYIATIADEKVMVGDEGLFYPSRSLSRAEMAAILTRAYSLTYGRTFDFSDITPSFWAYEDIQALADNQITVGYPDRTYRPQLFVTRAQFSVFMARVLDDKYKPDTLVHLQNIKDKWEQYKPSFIGDPFIATASTKVPFSPSQLEPAFINDGLKMANFVRFLAGLPDDLTLTSELNEQAGYGAVLLATSEFSHYPTKPTDMSDDFYDIAVRSTSTSNIGMGNHYEESDLSQMLSTFVNYYMIDFGLNNLKRVGHRQHILNPNLKNIGFGFATNNNYHYVTMQVFDRSRSERVEYDYIAYPTKDYFPVELSQEDIPWSVTLSSVKYEKPNLENIKVTVTRLNDGAVWSFDQMDNEVTEKDKFVNVDEYTIVFRPDNIYYNVGDRYSVSIEGLEKIELLGTSPATISYETEIIQLDE